MDYYFKYLRKEFDQILNKSVTISKENSDKNLKKLQYITVEDIKSDEENIVIIDKYKSLDNCVGYKYIKIKNVHSHDNLNIDIQNIVMNAFCNIIYLEDIKYNGGSLVFKNNKFKYPIIKTIEQNDLDKIVETFIKRMKDKYLNLMIKPLKIISIDNETENIDLNLTMHPNYIIFYVKNSKINSINLKISKNQHIFIISTNSEFNMSMNNNIGKECPEPKKCPKQKKCPKPKECPTCPKPKECPTCPKPKECPTCPEEKNSSKEKLMKYVNKNIPIRTIKYKSKKEPTDKYLNKLEYDVDDLNIDSNEDDTKQEKVLKYESKPIPIRTIKYKSKKKDPVDKYFVKSDHDTNDLNFSNINFGNKEKNKVEDTKVNNNLDSEEEKLEEKEEYDEEKYKEEEEYEEEEEEYEEYEEYEEEKYKEEKEDSRVKQLINNKKYFKINSFYFIFLIISILLILLMLVVKSPKEKINNFFKIFKF